MEESILTSTKKLLNVGEDDASFDLDIITHINDAFSHLHLLGIGPTNGFVITDASPTWVDFLPVPDPVTANYQSIINMVKSNVQLRVRLAFDPPDRQHVLTAFENQLAQSVWKLSVMREETEWVDPDPPDLDPELELEPTP